MGIAVADFFERCKACKACCKTSDRFVHIHVCGHEKQLIEQLNTAGSDIKDIIVPFAANCRFLSVDGCTLGDIKPFQCRLYPLLFLGDGTLGVDPACTFSGEYISELKDPSSDASRHFDAMKGEASHLGEDEKRSLADWSRFICDIIALEEGKY